MEIISDEVGMSAQNSGDHISDSKKFLGYDVEIGRVKPTKCFIVTSCPCEKENASIRNFAVDAIEDNDTAMVACRYLQARKGQKVTKAEAIFHSSTLNCWNHGCVNIRNTLRYKKTKRGCKTYLVNNLGFDKLKEIIKLPYTIKGLLKLKTILPDTCSMEKLNSKIERKVEWPSCKEIKSTVKTSYDVLYQRMLQNLLRRLPARRAGR